MTNKKFYIFLFICFFLSKEIFATSYCKKKTLNSVKFFKEEDFPIINLVFKKKIDIDDIYYNSYYYDENEGEDVRDFLVFYYGKPDGENFTYFCTTPDFNDVLNDIIQKNSYEKVFDKKATEVKIAFKDYKTMSGTIKQFLTVAPLKLILFPVPSATFISVLTFNWFNKIFLHSSLTCVLLSNLLPAPR